MLGSVFSPVLAALDTHAPSQFLPMPGYWVHDLDPFLVRFPKGFFLEGIRWYGLAYVATFIFGAVLLRVYHKHGKSPLGADRQSVLVTIGVIGVLVGGRLGYVLGYMLPQDPRMVFSDPLVIFRVNDGGMASHGGMIGVWVALAWFAWRHKMRFWQLLDIVVTLAPTGFLLGRIANFINGELWGRVTAVPWAVVFPRAPGISPEGFLLPRHPSQLYASVLEGVVMLAWIQWRFWRGRLPEGQLVGEAMAGYAMVRILGEFFREPDYKISWLPYMSPGQFFSVFLGLLGVGVIVWARWRAQKGGEASTPDSNR